MGCNMVDLCSTPLANAGCRSKCGRIVLTIPSAGKLSYESMCACVFDRDSKLDYDSVMVLRIIPSRITI